MSFFRISFLFPYLLKNVARDVAKVAAGLFSINQTYLM